MTPQTIFWSGTRLAILWIAVITLFFTALIPYPDNLQFALLAGGIFGGVALLYILNRHRYVAILYIKQPDFSTFAWLALIMALIFALIGIPPIYFYVSIQDKPALDTLLLLVFLLMTAFIGASLIMIGTAAILIHKSKQNTLA